MAAPKVPLHALFPHGPPQRGEPTVELPDADEIYALVKAYCKLPRHQQINFLKTITGLAEQAEKIPT